MSVTGLIFFFLFAAILIGVYIAMRRRLASVRILAAVGVFGGIVSMTLFAMTQDNILFIHALLVGIVLGGGLSFAVIMMAWYFLAQELRAAHGSK